MIIQSFNNEYLGRFECCVVGPFNYAVCRQLTCVVRLWCSLGVCSLSFIAAIHLAAIHSEEKMEELYLSIASKLASSCIEYQELYEEDLDIERDAPWP